MSTTDAAPSTPPDPPAGAPEPAGDLPDPDSGGSGYSGGGSRRHRAALRAGRPAASDGPGAAVVRGAGEVLITLGTLLLLFCVYQLFYTNVPANRAMAKEKEQLHEEWRAHPLPVTAKAAVHRFAPGEGFAIMYIPRLGRHYAKPVVEGVTLDALAKGIGHYPKTALPGRVGNFAVAGHRATHGEPFAYLPKLRRGDDVIVETADTWYVYVMDSFKYTSPDDVGVVLPVPEKATAVPKQRLITLTTCHPRWASFMRFIVWGHLKYALPKKAGHAPAELAAPTT